MTRINCVPPEELTREHLVAEYRELPRVFGYVDAMLKRGDTEFWRATAPYRLGKGHMRFFYTRLLYLSKRHATIIQEMKQRGYEPKFTQGLGEQWFDKIPAYFWNDWTPTNADMGLNRKRIATRLSESKLRKQESVSKRKARITVGENK